MTRAEASRRYRQRHPERIRERRREERRRLREEGRKLIHAFKANPCVVCGRLLAPHRVTCHHRFPSTKNFGIREWLRSPRAYGLRRLREELALCDPMCGGCHSRLHWLLRRIPGQVIYALVIETSADSLAPAEEGA